MYLVMLLANCLVKQMGDYICPVLVTRDSVIIIVSSVKIVRGEIFLMDEGVYKVHLDDKSLLITVGQMSSSFCDMWYMVWSSFPVTSFGTTWWKTITTSSRQTL